MSDRQGTSQANKDGAAVPLDRTTEPRQLSKESFSDYLLTNIEANCVRAMPILYRLANPHRPTDNPTSTL